MILPAMSTTNLRTRYRDALTRLRDAQDATAAVKARFKDAVDQAVAQEQAIQKEVADLEDKLDRAVEIADQLPTATSASPPTASTTPPPVAAKPPPATGTPPVVSSPVAPVPYVEPPDSLREVILAIPLNGDIGFPDLQAATKLRRTVLNTRLAKCKKRQYVESAGHGRYRLANLGAQVHARHGQGLRVVSPSTKTGN